MIAINDSLLIKMIEQDLLQKGIKASDYFILADESFINPQLIEVKPNEAVYICFCTVIHTANISFDLSLTSATSSQAYSSINTKRTTTSETEGTSVYYESAAISSHWSSISVQHNLPLTARYIVRTVRIQVNPTRKSKAK